MIARSSGSTPLETRGHDVKCEDSHRELVMWDNRQARHRVRRYDQSRPRDMRRATVAGTEPTVAQEAA
jgi:hypothetical protein